MGYPKLQTNARIFAVVCATLILTTCLWAALSPAPTHAATTIPLKINFQGRLTDASGNIKPNGLYNIKFRLFDALSAGTNKFEEDYVMTGVDNRVQVTNGLFNVQFGTLTSLASFDFSLNPNLWLEVELPTPATATCNTNACAVFTEGAMSPRQPLASAPYAFNADKLDGVDGSQFARNDAGNTFTTGDQAINRTSLTAFQIQNAGSTGNLFIANTTNTVIGIGAAPSAGGDILQVTGSVNASTSLKVGATTSLTATTLTIASTSICTSSGCAPSSGSTNYIQNQNGGGQAGANFNIAGSGTLGGALAVTGTSTFNGSGNGTTIAGVLFKNASNSVTAFQIQNVLGTSNLFDADTNNTRIGIGNAAPGYTLDVTGDINSSSGLRIAGTTVCTSTGCTANVVTHTKIITLTPEYSGAVLDPGSGANNTGTMTSGFDATQRESYYQWTTAQASNQNYDVVAQIPVPSDWAQWSSTSPITIDIKTSDITNGTVIGILTDTNGTVETNWNTCTLTPGTTAWTTKTGCALGSVTANNAANGIMTLRLRLQAPLNGTTQLGNIKLSYTSAY